MKPEPFIAPVPFVYPAKVVGVHDGDTVTLLVQMGYKHTWEITVRMHGYNAAELSKPGGKEARNWLAAQVLDKDVIYQSIKDSADKYGGRWLGIIWLDGVCINLLAVALNHGIAWDGKGVKPVPATP